MDKKSALVREAITILRDGGIVIYPTDTAFGIGCRIDDHAAVDRLFSLRRRPPDMATPVLVDSQAMALAYFDSPSDIVRHLSENYWPGALTIISECDTDRIYSPIRGGSSTVGLRMPDHATTLSLIQGIGVPIIGTSANFHGHPTPYSAADLDPQLTKLVDMVVPGNAKGRSASTVVDCSTIPYRIVRQGEVRLPEPAAE